MPVVKISEQVGYIAGAGNIGVLIGDSATCAMIDTGLNSSTARKALRRLPRMSGSRDYRSHDTRTCGPFWGQCDRREANRRTSLRASS